MQTTTPTGPNNGDYCEVAGGTHAEKSGTVSDIKTSKTGHVTLTVEQKSGVKFKTLARNVVIRKNSQD